MNSNFKTTTLANTINKYKQVKHARNARNAISYIFTIVFCQENICSHKNEYTVY